MKLRSLRQFTQRLLVPDAGRFAERDSIPRVRARTLPVRDLACLKKAMGWARDPLLEGDHLHEYRYPIDLNERPLRDAEVIGAACCNGNHQTLLEIGTAHGHTTALMALNAPQATVHTVNIPPEELAEGGTFTTYCPTREEIGQYYHERGCANVQQVLANTSQWEPDIGPIDVAFIDGCHDAEFVFSDTAKVLAHCRPGSLILWHDFAPELAGVHEWIGDVCRGIERLYREHLLVGPILHLQDSWVGLYRVGEIKGATP